jgi:hydrogenase maturation factor
MTNLASEARNARCGDYVLVIVGFRGVRLDPEETPDDRKLTGFG